jgi:polar amino acid transport system substrate-binding protein
MASLQEAFAKDGRTITASWGKDRQGMIAAVFEANAAQFAVPWETPVCSGEETMGPNSALLCDRALLSDPLFQLLYVLFIRPDSNFDLASAEKAEGGVLCAPADHEMPELSDQQRQWIASKKLALTRPATIIDCLGMLERKEADALLVNEIEGRFTLARLGLTNTLRMAESPVATRGVHIAMAKDQPEAEVMLAKLNEAIAQLRKSGRYGEIVARHLVELQGETRAGN